MHVRKISELLEHIIVQVYEPLTKYRFVFRSILCRIGYALVQSNYQDLTKKGKNKVKL